MIRAPIRDISAKDIASYAVAVIRVIPDMDLPEHGRTWLRQGMDALLSGQDIRLALGLKKAHGERAESGVQKAHRNERIRALAACIDPENREPTATSDRVAEIIIGSLNAPDGMEDIVESIRQSGAVGARTILRIQSAGKPACDVSATLNPLICLWESGR